MPSVRGARDQLPAGFLFPGAEPLAAIPASSLAAAPADKVRETDKVREADKLPSADASAPECVTRAGCAGAVAQCVMV